MNILSMLSPRIFDKGVKILLILLDLVLSVVSADMISKVLNNCRMMTKSNVLTCYIGLCVAIQHLLEAVENINSTKEVSTICTMGLTTVESYDLINSL